MKALLVLFLLPLAALAEQLPATGTGVEDLAPTYMAKMVIGLVVVLAMVLLFAWLMKKFSLVQSNGNGLIKVISAIPVGQRERIALIQVGDEQILVGLTPGRIEKLHDMKNAVSASDTATVTAASFRQRLQQAMKKGESNAVA